MTSESPESPEPPETTNTVIVGGGQAGLAMSEHLSNNGIPHLILEKERIAERWRTARWDGLSANGPAWHDRFPTMEFPNTAPDDFPSKETVALYFEAFAKKINAPIRCGVTVTGIQKNIGQPGFTVETTGGAIQANQVVCATGPFQTPIIPPVIPQTAAVHQIHSNSYFNPEQLPEGAVLVVGSGSSGAQIADELLRSGREVYLSVGPHDRPPRSYRGRDFVWWLGVLGKWDAAADPDKAHVTIAVSGAHGGYTVDFRRYAERGMTLVGMTQSYADGTLKFADDLVTNVAYGDSNYLSMLDEADAYVERNGLQLPLEPEARQLPDDPECLINPIKELDLKAKAINSIVWATGYSLDFSWLTLDVFDNDGKPVHQRGVSPEPGIYFLGLPWLSRRGSSFIWGVWHDAKFIADHIATQRSYLEYNQWAMDNHPGDGGNVDS